jgi:hypothetical protein
MTPPIRTSELESFAVDWGTRSRPTPRAHPRSRSCPLGPGQGPSRPQPRSRLTTPVRSRPTPTSPPPSAISSVRPSLDPTPHTLSLSLRSLHGSEHWDGGECAESKLGPELTRCHPITEVYWRYTFLGLLSSCPQTTI